MTASAQVIWCNECREKYGERVSKERGFAFRCARCHGEMHIEASPIWREFFMYCSTCSLHLKRCFACGHKVSPDGSKIIPNYAPRSIEEALERLAKAKSGDTVLVVCKKYEFHGCTGFGYRPRPEDYTLDTRFFMGVLTGEGPHIQTGEHKDHFTILVSRHVTGWNHGERLEEKPIVLSLFHFLRGTMGEPLYSRDHRWEWIQRREFEATGRADYPLEIVIGRDEVENYCISRRHKDFYVKAAKLLGMDKDSELVKAELQKRREEVLKRLLVLSLEEDWHTRDAKTEERAARAIRDTHAEMRRTLQEAAALGMDSGSWTKTYPRKPGWSLDVPAYVKGLQERLQEKENPA